VKIADRDVTGQESQEKVSKKKKLISKVRENGLKVSKIPILTNTFKTFLWL